MTGVYTELENLYAGKSVSPLQGGSSAEPEGPGQTEAYGRSLSPLTLPPLTGTLRAKALIHTHTQCAGAFRRMLSSVGHDHVSLRLSVYSDGIVKLKYLIQSE